MARKHSLRRKVYKIIKDPHVRLTSANDLFDILLLVLIGLNAAVIILDSYPQLRRAYHPYFHTFELYSMGIFLIEYLLRVWTIVENPHYRHPVWGRLRWMATPMAIIDFLAVVPFFLPFIGLDFAFIRVLRLLRIFRLLKVVRYVKALHVIKVVLNRKKAELIVSVVLILFTLLVVSCLMYYVENEAQPTKFSSIPAAMWWGIATLTTIGYGDIYPITPLGKLLGGLVAILGLGLFALPTAILVSGFSEHITRANHTHAHIQHHLQRGKHLNLQPGETCPCCGRPWTAEDGEEREEA